MMRSRSPVTTYTFVALGLTLVVFLALVYFTHVHPYVLWLAATGVTTFVLYGYDKVEARVGGGRVPENVLHGLALAGGFVGGWLGRFAFRHKTRKPVFMVVLAVATVLHLLLIYFVFVV